jgi:hypothetical protein
MRAILLTILLVSSLPAFAHERSLQHVEITIEGARFTATTPIEPLNLLNRIELRDGEPITIDDAQATITLRGKLPAIATLTTISFDTPAGRITPRTQLSLTDNRLTITGATPSGATHVLWRNQLASGDSVLFVRDGDLTADVPLHADELSAPIALAQRVSLADTFASYFRLGVLHIVPLGLDHILFVLGLFFLSPRVRTLLTQISLFTLAHTVTLGLSIFGLVSLDPRFVEPMIALSIVYVAIENVTRKGSSRMRYVIVPLFGLLHGLGFASALRAVGLPASGRLSALIAFNLGVEGGQLIVVAGAAAVVALYRAHDPDAHRRLAVPVSLMIAAVGMFWTVQRVMG